MLRIASSCALLLVLLLGSVECIRYPLSYQYRYRATVSTGVPDVGSQRATATLQTTVYVDTFNPSHAIVKFKDTRVGALHGDTHCGEVLEKGHKAPLPPSVRKLFHTPFHMNYRYNRRPIMDLSGDEPVWMTNLRKSIVTLLRIVPSSEHLIVGPLNDLATNSLISSGDPVKPLLTNTFSVTEETMQGACVVQYTLTPAPSSERSRLPVLRRDIQQKAGQDHDKSWPKVSQHLHLLQRTVQLETCKDRPALYYSSKLNSSEEVKDYMTEWGYTRLLLRGERDPQNPYNLRLEVAEAEGGVDMKPLGVGGGALQVIANQSLVLEATTYSRRRPRPSRRLVPVRSMKYQVLSPFTPAQRPRSHDWIRYQNKGDLLHPVYPEAYLAGHSLNDTVIQNLKSKLLKAAKEAARILETSMASYSSANSKSHRVEPSGATVAPEAGEHVASMVDIVRALPRHVLQDLLGNSSHQADMTQKLVWEAIVSSGSPAATELLLKELLKPDLPPATVAATLATLATAARAPATATQLLEFLKELAKRSHATSTSHSAVQKQAWQWLLQASVLMTSSTIQRLCHHTSTLMYGADHDAACMVQEQLLQFIKEQIQGTSSRSERACLVYAVGYLSSDEAFKLLTQLVTSPSSSSMERTASMFAMMPEHTSPTFKRQVFNALQPVLESQVESPEVREVAAMVLFSWRPNLAWWLRMARATWHERSKSVAEFLFTAMMAIERLQSPQWREQSDHASRALSLSKPVLTSSRQSFYKIIESYATPPIMESETTLGWILNVKTMLPEELLLSLNARMNGIHIPLMEALFLGDDISSFWHKLRATGTISPQQQHTSGSPQAKLRDEIGAILHGMGARPASTPTAEGLLLLRVFAVLHLPLSLNLDSARELIKPVLQANLAKESRVQFVKYLNPVERELVVPLDLGVPVIARVHAPSLLYQKGVYSIRSHNRAAGNASHEPGSNSVEIGYNGNTTFSTSLESTLSVLVPWLNQTLSSGVQLKGGVLLTDTTVTLAANKQGVTHQLDLHLAAHFDRKVPVVSASTVPFTVSRELSPGPDHPGNREQRMLKTVLNPHQHTVKNTYHLPTSVTGLPGLICYEGQGEPLQPLHMWWAYLLPTYTPSLGSTAPLRNREVTLFLDTSGSATNAVNVSFAYVPATKSNSKQGQDFVELQLNDTMDTRRNKLEQFTGSGGFLASVNATLTSAPSTPNTRGTHTTPSTSNTRRYDLTLLASAATAANAAADTDRYRYQATFLSSGAAPTGPTPVHQQHRQQKQGQQQNQNQHLCLHTEVLNPRLPPMARLDSLLQRPLTASVTATLHSGGSCDPKHEVAKLRAELSVSDRELLKLGRNLPSECNFDRLDPTSTLRRMAFYDDIAAELSWKQEVPSVLLNGSYHLSNLLGAYTLPYTSSNCLHAPPAQRRVMLNVTRSLDSHSASGWLVRPGCVQQLHQLPVPAALDLLLPLHGKNRLGTTRGRHSRLPGVVPPGDQCYVLPQRVVTFDGVPYDMQPSNCQRVVLLHRGHDENIMLLSSYTGDTPSTGDHQLRLLWSDQAIDIRLLNLQATVNGEAVEGGEKHVMLPGTDTLLVSVVTTQYQTEVLLPYRLQLIVKPGGKLMIRLEDQRYRGTISGLCGDFDGTAMGDLSGPRGCLYTPTEGRVLAHAWTVQPCNMGDQAKHDLRKHQWGCPKTLAELSLPEASTYDPESCSHEVHRIMEESGRLCLTILPVRTCRRNCTTLPGTSREAIFEARCWAMTSLPESLIRGRSPGYLHFLEDTPGLYRPIVLEYPMECVPKRD